MVVFAVAVVASNSISARSTDSITVNTYDLSQENSGNISYWYNEAGDGSSLSIQDMDTVSWKYLADQHRGFRLPGIQWFRADIQLEGTQNEYDILAISISGLISAFELYWDGDLIDTGGVVANSLEDEVSGPIKKIVRLKREQTNII